MTDEERITKLEHRVRELQTAVVTLIHHLQLEHEVASAEKRQLDEIRALGDAAPTKSLLEQYSTSPHS
ncbi:MAG TPA: hypothetical protein VED41_09990 [Solirubrobacteraceae bacterium]|nr:hypothetical protein [Solirubrobacteraceae bacterium]